MKAMEELQRLRKKIESGDMPADEPVFVLRARDMLAGIAIRHWCEYAKANNVPVARIREAEQLSHSMERWPEKQVPGLPGTRNDCSAPITTRSLLVSGAKPDDRGRYSWEPIVDRESRTYLSVVPLLDGNWMFELSQIDINDSGPRHHEGIGLPVSTMRQLQTLLGAIRGALTQEKVDG